MSCLMCLYMRQYVRVNRMFVYMHMCLLVVAGSKETSHLRATSFHGQKNSSSPVARELLLVWLSVYHTALQFLHDTTITSAKHCSKTTVTTKHNVSLRHKHRVLFRTHSASLDDRQQQPWPTLLAQPSRSLSSSLQAPFCTAK